MGQAIVRNSVFLALLSIALLASLSCGGSSAPVSRDQSSAGGSGKLTTAQIANLTGSDREQKLIEGAKQEGALLWYTQFTVDQAVRPLEAAFKEKYPFINLEYVRTGGAQLLQRLINEAQAGKTMADVYDGTVAGGQAKQAGLAEKFTSPEMEALPKKYTDPDGMWVPVSVYYSGLGYNSELVPKDQVPASYDDLLNPKWKGKLAWTSDPGNGAPVLITALRSAWGDEKTLDYLKKLKEQGAGVSKLTNGFPRPAGNPCDGR